MNDHKDDLMGEEKDPFASIIDEEKDPFEVDEKDPFEVTTKEPKKKAIQKIKPVESEDYFDPISRKPEDQLEETVIYERKSYGMVLIIIMGTLMALYFLVYWIAQLFQ